MSCCIIAEIGVNHDGSVEKAMRLIDAAAKAGANVAKFQTYRASEITVPGLHQDMLAKYQLPLDAYPKLKQHAESRGLEFMSSPFDIESARFLKDLGVKRLKIGSGELTNMEFLWDVSHLGLPLILSTGMATLRECIEACSVVPPDTHLTVLHCVSAYPAKAAGYNLTAMVTLKRQVCCAVGLSDHTLGDHVAIAAVAMGAQILEKHITLCYEDEGPDHAASMEPFEFGEMVRKIREVESAMGDGIKRPTPEELLVMPRARRTQTAEGFKRNP